MASASFNTALCALALSLLAVTSCKRRHSAAPPPADSGTVADLAVGNDGMVASDGGIGGPIHVARSPNVAIPDSDSIGISDTAMVTDACTIASVSVGVMITHPYIGDLQVDIAAPSGTSVRLHAGGGSTMDNLIGTYPDTLTVSGPGSLSDFEGEASAGVWRLSVADQTSSDEGTLNTWSLDIECD